MAPSPSPDVTGIGTYLGEWLLRSGAAVLATMGVIRLFFRPASDDYIFEAVRRKEADVRKWLDGVYKEVLAERQKAFDERLREIRDDWDRREEDWKRQHEELKRKCEVAEANKDRIEAMETIQGLHSAECAAQKTELASIRSEMRDLPRVVDALERIEHAMDTMARSVTETRDIAMKLQGQWDGRGRRSTDPAD